MSDRAGMTIEEGSRRIREWLRDPDGPRLPVARVPLTERDARNAAKREPASGRIVGVPGHTRADHAWKYEGPDE